MSRQLKYVIGTIVVLGCILCGIGIFSSLDSKGKMTHYSCNTKPDNEGEGPILKQHLFSKGRKSSGWDKKPIDRIW